MLSDPTVQSRAETTWQAVHLVQLRRLSSSCQSWAAVNRVYSMCVRVGERVYWNSHYTKANGVRDIELRYNWFKIPVLPCTSGHHRSLIFYLRFFFALRGGGGGTRRFQHNLRLWETESLYKSIIQGNSTVVGGRAHVTEAGFANVK